MKINTNTKRFLAEVIKNLITPSQLSWCFNKENWRLFLKYKNLVFVCPNCGKRASPIYAWPNLKKGNERFDSVFREGLYCNHCLSNVRIRTIAVGL